MKISFGRIVRLAIVTLVTCIAALNTASAQQANAPKPNIVFILVDNLGYGELGVYGGGVLRGAPDQLAAEGLRLTNFNV